MQRFQQFTLIAGLIMLAAALYRRELALPDAPRVYFVILTSAFALSTMSALFLAVSSRSVPLPARAVASYFFATAGLAFMAMAAYNDMRANISYPVRFAWFLSVLCVLFVIPWLITQFRILHRSPLAFDASLPPFFAAALVQFTGPHPGFELFWASGFWLFLGIPTAVASYYVMCRRLTKGRSTMPPLLVSTAVLYFVLSVFM